MQTLSIIEPPTQEAIRAFAEEHNLTKYLKAQYVHPQEDHLIASEEDGVFVVSDGVTLNFKKLAEKKEDYPNPSPAGEVAKIFCESVSRQGNDIDVRNIFKKANAEVKKYIETVGTSEYAGNQTGYYSATGAFVIIKENKAYWTSICDAFVAHFDKNMDLRHISSGVCKPYAVINGEERMAEHLEHGVFNLAKHDRIFVFTDGFEHYMKNNAFLGLFKNWDDTLKERVTEFSKKMNLESPKEYGHERSLIAIHFE